MMQAATDIFLGWTSDEPLGDRFLCSHPEEPPARRGQRARRAAGAVRICPACGRTLARAHARSGDPAVIAGYMGRNGAFDDALALFAMAYAEQTVKDYAALVKAKGGAKAEAPLRAAKAWRKLAPKPKRKLA